MKLSTYRVSRGGNTTSPASDTPDTGLVGLLMMSWTLVLAAENDGTRILNFDPAEKAGSHRRWVRL